MPRALATRSQVSLAISMPLAAQVLALPLLQDGLGVAVGQMLLRHREGRALDQIGGVAAGARTGHVRLDQRKVQLGMFSPDAAVDARGRKALCGADAAFNRLKHFHGTFPLSHFPRSIRLQGQTRTFCPVPASGSCTAPPRPRNLCPEVVKQADQLHLGAFGVGQAENFQLVGPARSVGRPNSRRSPRTRGVPRSCWPRRSRRPGYRPPVVPSGPGLPDPGGSWFPYRL